MLSRKSKKPTTFSVNLDDLDDVDDVNKDPYHDSDDGQDPDFVPKPSKKKRPSEKQFHLRKAPTRRERLDRLKRISQKYKSNENVTKSQSSIIQNPTHKNISNGDRSDANFDSLFSDDVQINDMDSRLNETNHSLHLIQEVQPPSPVQATTTALSDIRLPPQAQNALCPLVDMVLDLQGKISDLNNNVILLRKQVSRVELKTIGWPIGLDGRAHVISNGLEEVSAVCSEDLLDFESLLARDGLPKTTCVEINELEAKLRSDLQYRTKLVRSLLTSIYFCI